MEQNIWSAHLSDDLVNIHGPISKRKLDRIGNSILDKQKKFRAEILQPTSRKLIEKWEEMRTNEWKTLPEEQRIKEKIAYEHEREQLVEGKRLVHFVVQKQTITLML